MPRADRFPEHYDYCVRAREQGLDQVAEYIHKIVADNERMRGALIHIYAFYPISLNEPNKTIRAMQEVAQRGLNGEE